MKITIITPSFNSGLTIEKSIQSVLNQDYTDVEHIIVDGGSTDNTLDVLKKYPHLKWTSESDRGQVHAMNKGFASSTGEIISYLNADDYYLNGAFSRVISHFQKGEKMVMGNVLVRSEKADGIEEWTCNPKTDFPSVLRHWESNAFCVNPVGYFYLREVQENIPIQESSGAKHDLEFLMEAARQYTIKKIEALLGVFNHAQDTQTGREQLIPSYWQPENFPFVERLLKHLSKQEQNTFRLDRERGYQLRRQWTVEEAFSRGMAKELFDEDEIFMLPEDELDCTKSRCGFVEHDRVGTKGDWIIPVMTMGKVASKSICQALKNLPNNILPAQCYHLHQINPVTIHNNLPGCLPGQCHPAVGLSLKSIFNNYNSGHVFKFIAGMRDPLAGGLSGVFEIHEKSVENIKSAILNVADYILSHFTIQYKDALGIDVYKYPFDPKKGYTIIKKDNVEVLIFRFEDLPRIFSSAMEEFLGIPNLELPKTNKSSSKHYSTEYSNAKQNTKFEKKQLEKIYSHEMVKHFYTKKEVRLFYKKWLANHVSPSTNSYHGVIYDIGMHIGQDTEFYLKKGFKVIAVDANPTMCMDGRKKFHSYIDSGQLVILNVGIVEKATDENLLFYVNEKVSEWSSFIKEIAVRDNSPYRKVEVPCMTLVEITEKYGKPYYVKIDIEGHDHIALKSLLSSNTSLPDYVSVENGNAGMPEMLFHKGYDQFKYVQQNSIQDIQLPKPAKEFSYIEHKFPFGASGPFGEEAQGQWKSYEDILIEIGKVWDPESFAKNPDHDDAIHGWFDLHAKLSTKNELKK